MVRTRGLPQLRLVSQSSSAEPLATDEHEEEPEEEEEDSEDDLEAETDSEMGERVVDSDDEAEDFLTADQRAEIDAYEDYRAGLGEVDNQFQVAKRSRKLAKVAMDKFESDELFYTWLLNDSGKNFAVDEEKMLENRVKDAHERYLGAKRLNEGSMRMDPLAMGQVEGILMEWVMDKSTDAKGNVFKEIVKNKDAKTTEKEKDLKTNGKDKDVGTTEDSILSII